MNLITASTILLAFLWYKAKGDREGLNAPGDRGGLALIGPTVAGIASYTASLHTLSGYPDIDSSPNSSFGKIGA
jgi:hypothetical protein